MSYISFGIDNKEKWRIKTNTEEILAGMVAASEWIINQLDGNFYFDTDLIISKYKIISGASEELIPYYSVNIIDKGIWLRDPTYINNYNLYQYNKSDFLQGLISLMEHFNIEAKILIYGLPFDSKGVRYDLSNYQLTTYKWVVSVPSEKDDGVDKDDEALSTPFTVDNAPFLSSF